MDKQCVARVQNEIRFLRKELYMIAERYGLRSKETIRASQLLDKKINEYNKMVKQWR